MKLLLAFFLLTTTLTTTAQLQFWNTADIEAATWNPYYASQKIKKITVYQVDEHGQRIHPDMPKSVTDYDASSHIIAARYNKYNWVSRKSELLSADSFFYNSKGQLTRYSDFTGPRMEYSSGAEYIYNPKGQQIRQDDYEMENYERTKAGTNTFSYSPAGKPVKLVSKNKASVLDYSRQFTYDARGHLTRHSYTSDGSTTYTTYTRNDKDQLLRYKEIDGKDTKTTVTFTYDHKGRRTAKHLFISGGVSTDETYSYRGDEMLPYLIYITYPGEDGAGDLSHEWWEWVYE